MDTATDYPTDNFSIVNSIFLSLHYVGYEIFSFNKDSLKITIVLLCNLRCSSVSIST